MSLRTRLIIAFLLLSVVPMSAMTLISYRSSVRTFENAARREASQSAIDIGRRMERITAEVGRRMDRMFVATTQPADGSGQTPAVRDRVAPMLGETAALVERVEFHPMAPPPPAPAAGPNAPPPPPPWAGPNGRGDVGPPFPPGAYPRGRGRGRGPWPGGPPTPAPEVIVVDVQQAIEDAKKAVRSELAASVPELAPLVEESLTTALPAAEAALKAAGTAARSAE